MPGASTLQRGNLIFDVLIAITVTPPASVVTATITLQQVTVPGINVGDCLSWNMTTTSSPLLTAATMFASAANQITIGWTTEGATISTAPAQNLLIEVCRVENYSLSGTASLPNGIY